MALTGGFVAHAALVMDRALRLPQVLNVVLAEEASDDPLWKSVSALHATVSKTSRAEETIWIFEYMQDAKAAGFLKPENLTTRFLTGTQKDHNKGYVDLILFKMRMRNFLVEEYLMTEAKELREGYRTALRHLFEAPSTFREKMGYPHHRGDLSWKAGWSQAADALLQLFEDKYL